MISVAREINPPDVLMSPTSDSARKRVTDFMMRPRELREQERVPFEPALYSSRDVVTALSKLFANKCAYCETPVLTPEVDHFRPMGGALNLDGDFQPDHYWWLAYEWSNLYLVCPECQTSKGNRFPVSQERAAAGSLGAHLQSESPLLLDPCFDRPEEELVFADDGSVSSSSLRGQITIEVLTLNRDFLVADRASAIQNARREWQKAKEEAGSAPEKAIAGVWGLMDPQRPFAAARQQYFTTRAGGEMSELSGSLEGFVAQFVEAATSVSVAVQQAAKQSYQTFKEEADSFTVASEATDSPGKGEYFLTSRRLERIHLRNFKTIADLTLSLTTAPGRQAEWLMLLGENGVGKSSVLQAVALTLMGSSYRDRLQLDATKVVRRGSKKGWVKIWLTGLADPIELRFGSDSELFEGFPTEPKILLLGYGATRHLPHTHSRQGDGPPFASVDNLFDPYVPLLEPIHWMRQLDDQAFSRVARALKELLPLDPRDRLIRDDESEPSPSIRAKAFGTLLTLDELSDGFQSVIALSADIMQVMTQRWQAMEVAEGIVLLDEIEAHLHPSWKMRIVASLRKAFPRVQFIATTHDPLCLRGLFDGEVAVLRRTSRDRVYALTDLPSVQAMHVDQLLMSEHFGLNSANDPELDQIFGRYYRLRSKPELSAKEEEELRVLQARLGDLRMLGRDRREQLVLDAADQFLADEPDITDPQARMRERELTKAKIVEIMASPIPTAERES